MFESSSSSPSDVLLALPASTVIPGSHAEPLFASAGGCNGTAKRFIDIVISLLALAMMAVPLLIIACLIRIDSPGPILFRQRRIGYRNLPFETLKFRTMYHHAPGRGRLRQTTRHDPRVTAVGAFLRRLSLDELPQLFNVLRGDMSLVGPRPHAPGTCAGGKPFELVTSFYPIRHRVRPGITGLAQVRGLRGQTETEEKLIRRVDADLEYIANWSLWLDFAVMARTAVSVLVDHNAY
jgi:lipopolysaccharide/colanic/teichoic acid biosynthesis glycosyltransferase